MIPRRTAGSHFSFCTAALGALFLAQAGCAARLGADRVAYSPSDLAQAVAIGAIAIAPDGGELAFVTDRSGAPELWTARIQRGVVSTPVQRTTLGKPIGALSYSYLGKLVFSVDQAPETGAGAANERYDLWILERGAKAAERLTDTPEISETDPCFSPDGTRIAFLADAPGQTRFGLEVLELRTRETRSLTDEAGTVLHPVWSADGKTLVATATGDLVSGELLVVELESKAGDPVVRRIAPPRAGGILWPVEWLPNGKLLGRATNDKGLRQLCTVELNDGTVKFVGPDAWDIDQAITNPKNGTVVFARVINGESDVRAIPSAYFRDWRTNNDIAHRVSQGGVVTALAIDRWFGRALVLREESNRPPELFLAQPLAERKTVAVKARAGRLPLKHLSRAELRAVRLGADVIDVWLWRPPVARLGTPPPAVMVVEAGPGRQGRPVFSRQVQALTEAGYAVVSPAWRKASDVEAIAAALAANGDLDGARVGLLGHEVAVDPARQASPSPAPSPEPPPALTP